LRQFDGKSESKFIESPDFPVFQQEHALILLFPALHYWCACLIIWIPSPEFSDRFHQAAIDFQHRSVKVPVLKKLTDLKALLCIKLVSLASRGFSYQLSLFARAISPFQKLALMLHKRLNQF
jgi:hypothetical protein